MKFNSFSLHKFPLKALENIISAKIKKIENINSEKISIIKKSLLSIFKKKFYGIALDFDGTLIPIEKRTSYVDPQILDKLIKLNEKKIPLFILTGRGKSIFNQFPLSNFLFKKYLFLAQYNGGKIILGDKTLISKLNAKNFKEYEVIGQFLKENKINFREKLCGFVCFDNNSNFELCVSFVSKFNKWKIVSTNYSFDILPIKISKYRALLKGSKLYNIRNLKSILKIGDSGDINGNDYDYLKLENSFSVGEYSSDLDTNFPIINEKNIFLEGPKGLSFILNHLKL